MNKYVEHLKEGLWNLYFSKLRSLLALLGVLVGTASVVAMILGGELATNEALKQFKSLGTDLLAVSLNSSSEDQALIGKPHSMTMQNVWDLSKTDSHILDVAPYTQLFYPISYAGIPLDGMTLGVTDSFFDVVHIKLQKGRPVSFVDQYAFYCVIGHDLAQAIKKISLKNPLGETLQVGQFIFVIVGIAENWPENSFVYANVDHSVMIPIMTSMTLNPYVTINNIIIRLTKETNIQNVEENLKNSIQQFVSGREIMFRSAKELISKMKKQSEILTVFLGLIGSISLIVGGIGVMNIMLISVIERRREIGIRMSVGATRFDIGLLFLMEAIALSLIGGVLGVGAGILIAYLIAFFWHWTFTFFLWPPLIGFSVSFAVGLFSGFYPAYLASKLNPIEALRAE